MRNAAIIGSIVLVAVAAGGASAAPKPGLRR